MTVLEGKITDTFICTSFVLQILRGSAKQDHFEYEPLCIGHTKKKKKKNFFTKSFHFPTFAKSELKKKNLKSRKDNTEADNIKSKLEQ